MPEEVEIEIGNTDASAAEMRRRHLEEKTLRPGNEAVRGSRGVCLLTAAAMLVLGMAGAVIFPPLDWSPLSWVVLVPLILVLWRCPDWASAWRLGFLWGYGFSFCSFFWLREIEWFIPALTAGVLGLFPACWAMFFPVLRHRLLISAATEMKGYEAVCRAPRRSLDWLRELMLIMSMAAWWCILEWVRSWVGTGFPWNYLAATQWQNLVLLQICEYTGAYGVSFVVVMVNFAIAVTLINGRAGIRRGKMIRPFAMIAVLLLVVLVLVIGLKLGERATQYVREGERVNFRVAVLQGDISQRRQASDAEAREALDKYLALSRQAAAMKPDLIVWPETAVPFPFRASDPLCMWYNFSVGELIRRYQIPFLIGSLDFADQVPGVSGPAGIVNSALFIDRSRGIRAKFDKVHIVPFGEFVPFRRYLPSFIIRMIDMGRDLTRGKKLDPIEIYPGAYAGISICFEDVFAYISRREAQLGANLLLVITNDAWYPTSAEPEQHLIGSIFRALETRLPMVRCGNNSASCLIRPDGVVADSIFKRKDERGLIVPDWSRRGSGIGVFRVSLRKDPELTFYSRFGDVFVGGCGLIFLAALLLALWRWRQRTTIFREAFK